MAPHRNPAGHPDVSGVNFLSDCLRFALLRTHTVGSFLPNASAPACLSLPCTSVVPPVATSGVWPNLQMGPPHPPPQPLAPSASPARGPPLVFGGLCFDLSFLPRHLPSQESPCATPSSATQRSAFETLPFRTDHSHKTAHFCKGSLSPPRSSRQPGPVPTNTAPGPGPCWLPALLPSAAFEAAWGPDGSRTAEAMGSPQKEIQSQCPTGLFQPARIVTGVRSAIGRGSSAR